MAGLRKGKAYREVKRAYTRKSKFHKKSYIKAVPNLRIVRFIMGDAKKEFPVQLDLVCNEKIQIRQNALESARILINRQLNKILGTNYRLVLRLYPHHVLRENKMLTGAGADRMSQGMQLSFGKVVGTAAQVKKGQTIFTAYSEKKDLVFVKNTLKSASPRLPCTCRIKIIE